MKEFSEMIIAEQAPISSALERVIQTMPKAVQEIATYSLLSGGKRLRPMLSLISARLFSPEITTESGQDSHNSHNVPDSQNSQNSHNSHNVPDSHNSQNSHNSHNSQNLRIYDAAIVLEMFHVASLLHDDVLDNADTRRGQTSVHVKYGIRPCLLAGDALLAAGNRQMAEFAFEMNCPHLMNSISNALLHTSTGEIEEIALVGKILPCMDTYLSVIEAKTAWILRSACEVGAMMANASTEDIKRLATFGLNLGMAFQIIDDALDFAPEAITGKPCGGDLRERKCTPPILMYIESLDVIKRKDFEEKFASVPTPIFETQIQNNINIDAKTEKGFTENELANIIQEIIDNKYPEKTKALADSYLEQAEEAIKSFSNKYSNILLQTLHYVRARNK